MGMAANRRRGNENSTDKLHSEMSIEESLEHAVKSRVIVGHPEFEGMSQPTWEMREHYEL